MEGSPQNCGMLWKHSGFTAQLKSFFFLLSKIQFSIKLITNMKFPKRGGGVIETLLYLPFWEKEFPNNFKGGGTLPNIFQVGGIISKYFPGGGEHPQIFSTGREGTSQIFFQKGRHLQIFSIMGGRTSPNYFPGRGGVHRP